MADLGDDDTLSAPATRTSPFRRRRQPSLRATDPELVGRYLIERRLGEGGMGVVYVARDPELGRDVAVKIVHPRRGADEVAADRLLREARSMARLSHPNVVDVYDVGRCDGGIFIAMELVEGQSLERWLVGKRWSEVVDAFAQAGLGLAAAHEAGIVHRDFKPANVIVGDDGVARVLDFGLARAAGVLPSSTALAHDFDNASLTGTGSVVGTPAYMAPEQIEGGVLDARVDQFSFCVALYEALWGKRPWTASTWPQLAALILQARMPVPTRSHVPARFVAVVRRGLSRAPDDRFTDMAELVTALRTVPRTRRLPLFVGAAIGLAGVAALAWPERTRPCDPSPRMATVWNDAARSELARRFDDDGLHTRVTARLDDFAAQWSATYTELCGSDAEALDLHMHCLDRRLTSFGAVVGVLSDLDTTEIRSADGIVAGLPDVEACRDREALRTDVATAAMAAEIAVLERDVARADALTEAGRAPAALALAEVAVEAADRLGLDAAIAEAHFAYGNALRHLGRFAEARDAYERAFVAAMATDDDRKAFALATALVFVEGANLGEASEAQRWIEQAEALLDRGAHDPRAIARFHNNVGAAFGARGELDAARARHQRALALLEAEYGSDDLSVAHTLDLLASVASKQGRDAEAERLERRALAIQTAELGDDHPVVADSFNDLGNYLNLQRRYADAESAFRRSADILTAAYGEDNNRAMVPLSNLGQVLAHLGRQEEAKATLERALAVQERELGSDRPEAIITALALAHFHQRWGQPEDAEQLLLSTIAAIERVHGPDHADAALPLNSLAALYGTRGDNEHGREMFERVLAIRQRTLPPDHPWIAAAHYNIGMSLENLDRPQEAIAHYEASVRVGELHPEHDAAEVAAHRIGLGSALASAGEASRAIAVLREALPVVEREAATDPWFERQLADGRFGLARALVAVDSASGEAFELATAARDFYQLHTELSQHHLERIQMWLLEHRKNPVPGVRRAG